MSDARLLCRKSLAGYLDVSERTVDRLAKTGVIPKPVNIAGMKRWDLRRIDSIIDGLSGETGYVHPDDVVIRRR